MPGNSLTNGIKVKMPRTCGVRTVVDSQGIAHEKTMTKWPLINVSKDNTSWIAMDNVFTDQELDKIVVQANQVKKVSSTVGSGAVSDYRVCDIAWLESDDIESDFDWLYATLSDTICRVNNEYFRFDLTHLTALQYTVYNASNHGNYQKHLDIGRQFPNRKLSFSVQLSDNADYTGIEFGLLYNCTGVTWSAPYYTLGAFGGDQFRWVECGYMFIPDIRLS